MLPARVGHLDTVGTSSVRFRMPPGWQRRRDQTLPLGWSGGSDHRPETMQGRHTRNPFELGRLVLTLIIARNIMSSMRSATYHRRSLFIVQHYYEHSLPWSLHAASVNKHTLGRGPNNGCNRVLLHHLLRKTIIGE